MLFNNGSFVSSVSRFCTLTTFCPAAHPRIGHIREYAPQVTIACKPSSTIARFKKTEFRTSEVACLQTSSSLFTKYHSYFGIILMLTNEIS